MMKPKIRVEASKIKALQEVVGKLPIGKQDFAKSLISQACENLGQLSVAQAEWVDKLIALAANPAPTQKATPIGSVAGIIALFDTAKQHLKRPRIRLQPLDTYLELHRLTSASKYQGDIAVRAPNSGYSAYLGRVTVGGEFVPSTAAKEFPFIEDFLRAFAEQPSKLAAEFGRLTGDCAFCRSKLTDARSTSVGYGAVCAKKWGLPYPTMKELKQKGLLAA